MSLLSCTIWGGYNNRNQINTNATLGSSIQQVGDISFLLCENSGGCVLLMLRIKDRGRLYILRF